MPRGCDRLIAVGRRQFLRGSSALAAATAAATAGAPRPAGAAPAPALQDYPGQRLANLAELKVDDPLPIAYPDADSPGILLKLGVPCEGGVGPDRDIVAFSTMCPHKGFPLNYSAADRTLACPGHYSIFDCEKGGLQVWGQATQNLPQFKLAVDDRGDIYATGVDELLYGRINNVLHR